MHIKMNERGAGPGTASCAKRWLAFCLQKFLKDLVRHQPAARSEAEGFAVRCQQSLRGETFGYLQRRIDCLTAEFASEFGDAHAGVQAQTQEPGFLVPALRRKPRNLGWFRGVKIDPEISRGR